MNKSPVIPPYDTRTKFIEREKDQPSDAHQIWFQKVGIAINNAAPLATTPQIVAVPATLTSPGTVGQLAWDATGFYAVIAPNVWKKAAWL